MLSVPVIPDDASVASVFPDHVGSVYHYNPSLRNYETVTTTAPGQGYFVLYRDAGSLSVSGLPLLEYTIPSHQAGIRLELYGHLTL
jgi:hypothetical protein